MNAPAAAAKDRIAPAGPWLLLCLLPLLAHLPALSGHFQFDPIDLVSGLTPDTWHSNGLLRGYPWLDANAGVTTEALGALAAHDWLAGTLPWWNPYSGVGMPLVAEGQTPAFFLPFVFLLMLPHGLLLLRMLLMALSGLFAFALLRRLRLDKLPAFAGAAIFELNGTFGWLAHGPIMPIAFLPLTLLGLEQARGGKYPYATAAGVAFSFLAGFPETAVLNMLLAAAWGLLRVAQARWKARYAAICGSAAAAGFLIAAPAIWPFLEALPRGFVGAHAGMATGAFAPASLAQALFPAVLANPQSSPGAPQAVMAAWNRAGGYMPVAVLVLALAALRRQGPDLALRWVLAGFVAVTGARAAGLPPAIALFGSVPLLRQAALHTYIWPAWAMAASVLGAMALQDWRDGRRPNIVGAAVLAATLSVTALWFAVPAIAWLRQFPPPFYHPVREIAVGGVLSAVLLVLLRGQPTRLRQLVAVALPCAQLLALCGFWLLAGPHGRTPDMAAVRFLRNASRPFRVVSFGPLVPNYGAMFGIAALDYNALPVPADWVAAARARLQPDSNGIVLYEGDLPSAEKLSRVLPAYEAMGAKFALTWAGENLAARFPGAAPRYQDNVLSIWQLDLSAPYESAPGCEVIPSADGLSASTACAVASRLLRRELFDPGWRATVNGAAVPVAHDEIFQSVALPAGASVVRFSYAPPGIAAAWAGCVFGFLILLTGPILRRHLAPVSVLADDAPLYGAPRVPAEEPP